MQFIGYISGMYCSILTVHIRRSGTYSGTLACVSRFSDCLKVSKHVAVDVCHIGRITQCTGCDTLTEMSTLITDQQMADPVTHGADFAQAFFTLTFKRLTSTIIDVPHR